MAANGLPSITIGEGFEYLKFHDNNVSKMVKKVYQALSIHENSAFFEPIFRKGKKFGKCKECEKYEKCRNCEKCGKNEEYINGEKCVCNELEEIWFPGAHLEVGGGIYSVDQEISDESLRWMVEKIVYTGGLLSKQHLVMLEKKNQEHSKLEQILLSKPSEQMLTSTLSERVLSSIVYHIKLFTTMVPLMGRDRTIPLYRDDKGMLTFDHLYKKGYWKFPKSKNKFENIEMINEKSNSLTKFYAAMEDILIEELKRPINGIASNGKIINKYQEQNIEEIRTVYKTYKKNSYDEENNDDNDKINKKNIWELFNAIGQDKIDCIESFDAKTISKFNIERLIEQYKVRTSDTG